MFTNKLMRKIIVALGLHNPGEPYKVKVSDIIIPEEFKATKPRFKKMIQKREFYRKNDRFESKIVLNKDFLLIDGYTSYIIAKENGMKYVEAYFVD